MNIFAEKMFRKKEKYMKEQVEKVMEEYSNKIREYINSLEEINLQLENTIEDLKKKNDLLLHKLHTNDVKEQKILTLDNGVLLSYKQLSNIINTLATAETPEAKELAEYLIRFGNKTFDKQSENIKNPDENYTNNEIHTNYEFLPEDILNKLNANARKNEQAVNNIANKNIPNLFTQKAFKDELENFKNATPFFGIKEPRVTRKDDSIKDAHIKKMKRVPIEEENSKIESNNLSNENISNENPWSKMNEDIQKTKEGIKNKTNSIKGRRYNEDNDIKQFNEVLNKFFAGHPQDGSVLDLIDNLLNAHNHYNYNRWN